MAGNPSHRPSRAVGDGRVLLTWIALLAACASAKPANLGVSGGSLSPCPSAPHCVSTQATDARHAIAPTAYSGSRDEARSRLAAIIRSMPRAHVVSETSDYIHAEFPTRIVSIFGCADDLEVYIDDRTKLAHFRSSSRIRYYDFGSNRSRVEEIRARFLASES